MSTTTTLPPHTKIATAGRLVRIASIAVGAALALTACGGSAPEAANESALQPSTTVTTAELTTSLPPTTAPIPEVPTPAVAPVRAISTVAALQVFDAPDSDQLIATLADRTEFGSARVLLVEDTVEGWVRVQLPIRPNETSGWVRSTDVTLEEIDARVEVDLAARTVTTWINGEIVVETSVAVGSADNPTPTGTFFITDKVDTANDGGAYGPYALGLSAHSDTLTEFAGGDGQIGLHGTNAPESIGQAVSHGCVRLPNELIEVLATQLPLGTPVIIR